jgi:hypothetical protein
MSFDSPTGGSAINRTLSSPRALAAWALLGYAALALFFAFFLWLLPNGDTFSVRSANSGFRGLTLIALPVLAVLLAAYVTPELPLARLIALVAMIEYLAILFFGLITLLIGLGAVFDRVNTVGAFFGGLSYLVMGAAALILAAVASYICFRAYTRLGGRLPSMPS